MTALITGISGQDGAYLAAQLLGEGDSVVGTLRPGATNESLWRLRELGIADHRRLHLRELNIEDAAACSSLLSELQPFSLFHFAAQSRVSESFRDPIAGARVNGLATLHLLEAVRRSSPQTRFVFASSAEIYGDASDGLPDEATPFRPNNPYGVAKHFAHASTVSHRTVFGVHASCAILFNHESPLRDPGFVTRKIAAAAVRLSNGTGEPLELGNLGAQRDFGYAPEYVAAMAAMARREQAGDYVLATGTATSIREFATSAFGAAGIDVAWHGVGADEHAVARDGRLLVRVDPGLFRPADASVLVGNATKARNDLGFVPSTGVAALAKLMVEAEQRRANGTADGR